jgi:hypothetical protein
MHHDLCYDIYGHVIVQKVKRRLLIAESEVQVRFTMSQEPRFSDVTTLSSSFLQSYKPPEMVTGLHNCVSVFLIWRSSYWTTYGGSGTEQVFLHITLIFLTKHHSNIVPYSLSPSTDMYDNPGQAAYYHILRI